MRFFPHLALILPSLCVFASAQPALELAHTDDKPYSDSATVHPDAAILFTGLLEGRGEDLGSAASDALQQLDAMLKKSGSERADVANVRAYITSSKGEAMSEAMQAWNEAFTHFFRDNPNPPTRTTIGSFASLNPDSLIALDAIIAAEPEELAEPQALSSNPRLSAFSDLKLRAVAPFSSLLITSGVLADPLASGTQDFGNLEQQTLSTLGKLESTLLSWGLNTGDLVFTRILLSPQDGEEETHFLDTEGFQTGWDSFWAKKRAEQPPFSFFSGPGFSASGRLIEIEFYAVFPDAIGPFSQIPVHGSEATGPIIRAGNPDSFLSGSVAIARDAKKIWFSGAIAADRNSMHGQAAESLLTLHDRYENIGIDISDTVQLRAYLNFDGPFGPSFGSWNKAYRRFFDHEKVNPEKPVRTAFPIENLPAPLLIEIETLAATR